MWACLKRLTARGLRKTAGGWTGLAVGKVQEIDFRSSKLKAKQGLKQKLYTQANLAGQRVLLPELYFAGLVSAARFEYKSTSE
jgi:hypothetical protein